MMWRMKKQKNKKGAHCKSYAVDVLVLVPKLGALLRPRSWRMEIDKMSNKDISIVYDCYVARF